MSTALSKPIGNTAIFDETEVEVLRGIEVPKVSPKRRHARLQGAMYRILDEWAADSGEVGTEWRFWLSRKPGPARTTLVPDVAFVAGERMKDLNAKDAEEPPFAPTIAVEIRSPGDRDRNVRTKALLYLEFGALLVLDVDPQRRRIVAFDRTGERTFADEQSFEHAATPGLKFNVREFLARGDRRH